MQGALRGFAWLLPLAAALGIYASFASLSLELSDIFSAANRTQMRAYAAQFVPPDVSAAHLAKIWRGTLETLAISIVGTLLAGVLGFAIALPAAGRFGAWLRAPARLLLNFLRSIHELIWAALLVFAAGLGPFAGTLALGAHTAGVLGRLFAETFENTPDDAARALRESGAKPVAAFLYGTLPTVWPQLVAYTLYRWENNIRASTVLGVVGAGGLGQMLHFHLSLFQQAQAMSVIIAMIALVLVVEGASVWWRARLTRA
jgi:phosphonate transport system permease protein